MPDTIIAEYEALRLDDTAPVVQLHRLGTSMRAMTERYRWTRWIYLERSLELASWTGDLLSAAVTLRTMLEEAARLLALDEIERAIQTGSKKREDLRRWCNLLRDYHIAHTKDVKPKEISPKGTAGTAFKALNDYVHPNYGSHLAALFPERETAGRVILTGALAVYEEFFRLSWVTLDAPLPHERLPPLERTSAAGDEARLRQFVLPLVERHLSARYPAGSTQWSGGLQRLLSIDAASQQATWAAAAEIPDLFDGLEPLLDAVLVPADGRSLVERVELASALSPSLGLPSTVETWQALASARRLSDELDELAQRRSDVHDLGARLRFSLTAISLALVTSGIKHDAFERAALREAADSNPLAVMIPARSLLEDHAVAADLAERVGVAWRAFEREAAPGEWTPADLDKVDEPIARYLSGTKETEEAPTEWRQHWKALGLSQMVALGSAVASTFGGEPGAVWLYDYLSMVIHGTRCKGVELSLGDFRSFRTHNLYRGLLVVDMLAFRPRMMGRDLAGASVAAKIHSLARRLSLTSDEASVRRSVAAAILPSQLLEGVHYTGSGTREDPISISPALFYYEAFPRMCEQLGLHDGKRMFDPTDFDRPLDRVIHANGDTWFLAPLLLP